MDDLPPPCYDPAVKEPIYDAAKLAPSFLFPEISNKVTDICKAYNHANKRLDGRLFYRKLKASEVGKIHIVKLTGTVKLHGVHADIVIDHGTDNIKFRSRRQHTITINNDVSGVVAKLAPLRDPILNLRDRILRKWVEANPSVPVQAEHSVIIAGEWVGPGIFSTVAINELPRKVFVIISVSINGVWIRDSLYDGIDDPENDIFNINRVGRIEVELDIDNPAPCQTLMEEWTMKVERRCPFAYQLFGIEGIGEGIVWKMQHAFGEDAKSWVKTKGPLHAEANLQKLAALKAAGTDQDAINKAALFAEAFCVEARMDKVLMTTALVCFERKGAISYEETGSFMQFLVKDVLKEEQGEIAAQNVNIVLLEKEISKIGKMWFKAKMSELMDIANRQQL